MRLRKSLREVRDCAGCSGDCSRSGSATSSGPEVDVDLGGVGVAGERADDDAEEAGDDPGAEERERLTDLLDELAGLKSRLQAARSR